MKPRPVLVDPMSDGDEVARQRRRRAEALLDRAVPGFHDVTLRDILTAVVAARDEAGGELDVDRFLTDRGHGWRTVEMVHTCLAFVHPSLSSSPPPSSASGAMSQPGTKPGGDSTIRFDRGGPDGH